MVPLAAVHLHANALFAQATESLLASEHCENKAQVPVFELDEDGVNTHNPSVPLVLHATFVVYDEHTP